MKRELITVIFCAVAAILWGVLGFTDIGNREILPTAAYFVICGLNLFGLILNLCFLAKKKKQKKE